VLSFPRFSALIDIAVRIAGLEPVEESPVPVLFPLAVCSPVVSEAVGEPFDFVPAVAFGCALLISSLVRSPIFVKLPRPSDGVFSVIIFLPFIVLCLRGVFGASSFVFHWCLRSVCGKLIFVVIADGYNGDACLRRCLHHVFIFEPF
jgi:hypothetical protein